MRRHIRNLYILLKFLGESFSFAFVSVKANKLRTFLSLLGITIGIFSITSVFTMVDALEENVRSGIETLGSNVVYIQRTPWYDDSGESKWWEFRQRPALKYEEFEALQNKCKTAESVAFLYTFSRQLKYKNTTTSRIGIAGITYDWNKISAFDIADGRYFSPMETNSGSNVALIGHTVAKELFGNEPPVGKTCQIAGHKTRIIGLLEKQGNSIVNANDYDNALLIPFRYACTLANTRYGSPSIALKAKPGVDIDDLRGEIKTILRAQRRLKPAQKDNFAINELSDISQQLNPIMDAINLGGWIIGGFAILIGAFGVANIMFVSVRERTPVIGIQKAMGAKNYFILTQFLYESVLLTVAGGLLGLFLVFAATGLLSHLFDFSIALTPANILRGLLISTIVGILAGIIPAIIASRLNPVVAIAAK
ncbi:MAG: ABC transporter permease [Prevotellaceae bacterium]|jgi:putative ABC transport system permease protein|nr:ABC transporter permease [Prevotellaceae bacterium]